MTPQGVLYSKQYAGELLTIAKGDLASARSLLKTGEGRPENICYLAEQCVEKALKAVFCQNGLKIVHTHDLEALVNLLPEKIRPPHYPQFRALLEYATVRRYEQGYVVLSPEDLKAAIEFGDLILSWAKKMVQI